MSDSEPTAATTVDMTIAAPANLTPLEARAKKAHDDAQHSFFVTLDDIEETITARPGEPDLLIDRLTGTSVAMSDGSCASLDYNVRNRFGFLMMHIPVVALIHIGKCMNEDYGTTVNTLEMKHTSFTDALQKLPVDAQITDREKEAELEGKRIHDFADGIAFELSSIIFNNFASHLPQLTEQNIPQNCSYYTENLKSPITHIKQRFDTAEHPITDFSTEKSLLGQFRRGERSLSELSDERQEFNWKRYDFTMPSERDYMLCALKEAVRLTAQYRAIKPSDVRYRMMEEKITQLEKRFKEATRSPEEWLALKGPDWEKDIAAEAQAERLRVEREALKAQKDLEAAAAAAERKIAADKKAADDAKARHLAERAARLEHASYGMTPALVRMRARATRSGPGQPKAKTQLLEPLEDLGQLAAAINTNHPFDRAVGDAFLRDAPAIVDYLETGEGKPAPDPARIAEARRAVVTAFSQSRNDLPETLGDEDFRRELIARNRDNQPRIMEAVVRNPVLVIAALGDDGDIAYTREIMTILQPEKPPRTPLTDREKVEWRNALKEMAQRTLEETLGRPVPDIIASAFVPAELPPAPPPPPKVERPSGYVPPPKPPEKKPEADAAAAKTKPETPAASTDTKPTENTTAAPGTPPPKDPSPPAAEHPPIDMEELEARVRGFLIKRIDERPPYTRFGCHVTQSSEAPCRMVISVSRLEPSRDEEDKGLMKLETRQMDIDLQTHDKSVALGMRDEILKMVTAERLFIAEPTAKERARPAYEVARIIPDVEPTMSLDRRNGVWVAKLGFDEPPEIPEGKPKHTNIFIPLGLRHTNDRKYNANERAKVLAKILRDERLSHDGVKTSDHLRGELENEVRCLGERWEGAQHIDISQKQYAYLRVAANASFPADDKDGTFITIGDPLNTGTPTGDWKVPIIFASTGREYNEEEIPKIYTAKINTHCGTVEGALACIPEIKEHLARNLSAYAKQFPEAHYLLDEDDHLAPRKAHHVANLDNIDQEKLNWMIASLKLPCRLQVESSNHTQYENEIATGMPRFDVIALQADGAAFHKRPDKELEKKADKEEETTVPLSTKFTIDQSDLPQAEVEKRIGKFMEALKGRFATLQQRDFTPRAGNQGTPGELDIEFPADTQGWKAKPSYQPSTVIKNFNAAVKEALAESQRQGWGIHEELEVKLPGNETPASAGVGGDGGHVAALGAKNRRLDNPEDDLETRFGLKRGRIGPTGSGLPDF